jgi:hypothetical protein
LHISAQSWDATEMKIVRGTPALPSNNRTGVPEKSVSRKTESLLVGRNPVRLQLQYIGAETLPPGPIVVTDPGCELAMKIF